MVPVPTGGPSLLRTGGPHLQGKEARPNAVRSTQNGDRNGNTHGREWDQCGSTLSTWLKALQRCTPFNLKNQRRKCG